MTKPSSRRVVKAVRVISAFATVAYFSVALAADSRVQTWVSPNRQVTLSSVKAGDDLYQLELNRVGQAPVIVGRYERHVDVLWSVESKYVAITDWIGSNVATCYIIDAAKPQNKRNVSDILPRATENVTNSHFYVSCGHWTGATRIVVEAKGHTDYPPSRNFTHRFILDVVTGRVQTL